MYILETSETLGPNLILFHNIILGKIKLKHDNSFSILPTTTRGNPHNLFIPFCSSTIRKNSFFIDIPNIYRKLPTELQKSSIELFPKLLNNINLDNILSKPHSIQLSPDLIQNIWFILFYFIWMSRFMRINWIELNNFRIKKILRQKQLLHYKNSKRFSIHF